MYYVYKSPLVAVGFKLIKNTQDGVINKNIFHKIINGGVA